MQSPIIEEDLKRIEEGSTHLWQGLRNKNIFLSGATGFFGAWLLSSLLGAEDRLGLGNKVVILTRDPGRFKRNFPGLATHRALTVLRGDVRSFEHPAGPVDFVVHAAMDASAVMNEQHPAELFDVIVSGTRRMLDFSVSRGASRFLYVSSGAVYGGGGGAGPITEDERRAPDPLNPASATGEGKRAAEFLCAAAAKSSGLSTSVARCFSFAGPYMPLDSHFAAGNFMSDAVAGRPIHVKGDGSAVRSYLYPTDLAIWLWTILLEGTPCRAYNVGSERAVSIAELARLIGELAGGRSPVVLAGGNSPAVGSKSYVPSTERARTELGLKETVPLEEVLSRTYRWALSSAHADGA